jgi:hypothetical protein
MTRQYLKTQILSYVQIYFQKLLPVFRNIEIEAEELANDFYGDFMSQPTSDEYIDTSAIAEQAMDIGIAHYSYLSLGKYNLTATWHVTLSQLWEQQLRLFLFREMSHVYKLEFKTFCQTMNEIKNKFAFHNVHIETLKCWTKIYELRLLCNVIKHGLGDSGEKLQKINPTLFRKEPVLFDKEKIIDYIDTFNTTLLEETLSIDETTLQHYKEAVLSFWDEIPERSYSEEL